LIGPHISATFYQVLLDQRLYLIETKW